MIGVMGPAGGIVDDDGVVRIGSVIFALIRPTPGHETAFDRWYGRDHYYTTGLAAPGVFSAARFVQPDSGLHLALYFVLPGHDAARVAFATEQVRVAGLEGRMFDEREHLHTWSYVPLGEWRADPSGVPPALVLDHHYAEVTVLMVDGPIPDFDSALTPGDPDIDHDIDVVLALAPHEPIMASSWEGSADVSRRTTLIAFHRRSSEEGRDALTRLLGDDGFNWIESFRPVVFGT
jgi:hypothetical protein